MRCSQAVEEDRQEPGPHVGVELHGGGRPRGCDKECVYLVQRDVRTHLLRVLRTPEQHTDLLA